jgi:hypothetical protein
MSQEISAINFESQRNHINTSIQWSNPWEADGRSDGQYILCLVWNSKVSYPYLYQPVTEPYFSKLKQRPRNPFP